MSAWFLDSELSTCFLQHIVTPGADIYLPKLLTVMKDYDNLCVKRLADDIQRTMEPGR